MPIQAGTAGRVVTLTARVRDVAGNTATATVKLSAPAVGMSAPTGAARAQPA